MRFDNYIYAAIEGRQKDHPQDLIGILASVAQARGVLSTADHDKLPTYAEFSFSLQALIENGMIAEASPHRFYDMVGGPPQRTFSGLLQNEYENAFATFYRRLRQGLDPANGWRLDVQSWPGPNRQRWGINQDVVLPSPDGQFACVLYSCAEIRMGWIVGHLALLKGPREKPAVILSPPNFTCVSGRHCIQWLDGSRFCVVMPFLFNQADNRFELLGYTFLDVVNETFAHIEITYTRYLEQKIAVDGSIWIIPEFPDASGGKRRKE
jgi:hypothetical protein